MSILNARLPIGADLGYSVLSAGIDNSQTTITVSGGGIFPTLATGTNRRRFIPAVICPAADPATMTFSDLQSGEHIAITDHAAASNTLTVIRGDSPVAHESGSLVMILPTARAWESAFQYIANLESILAVMMGATVDGDGVVLNYGTGGSSFQATQSGTPNMQVQVSAGIGAYRDQVFRGAATALSFVAPISSTRIDRIVWDVDACELAIVEGAEGGGAPAVPARTVKLWRTEIEVGQTSILNADLTDDRVFA